MLKKGLLTLIISVILTSYAFSQNVTETDTSKVLLPIPIARLVIQDLIQADASKAEIRLLLNKILILEEQIAAKDSIIVIRDNQINNFNTIVNNKETQIQVHVNAVSELKLDLKKEKTKSKITSFATGGLVAIAAILAVL